MDRSRSSAVVGIRHVGARSAARRSRASAGSARAAAPGSAPAARGSDRGPWPGSGRSARSPGPRHWRAIEATSTPCRSPTRRARGSARSPSCQPWVPAESTTNRAAAPPAGVVRGRSPRPGASGRCCRCRRRAVDAACASTLGVGTRHDSRPAERRDTARATTDNPRRTAPWRCSRMSRPAVAAKLLASLLAAAAGARQGRQADLHLGGHGRHRRRRHRPAARRAGLRVRSASAS